MNKEGVIYSAPIKEIPVEHRERYEKYVKDLTEEEKALLLRKLTRVKELNERP